jgi:hypothetical protein
MQYFGITRMQSIAENKSSRTIPQVELVDVEFKEVMEFFSILRN